VKTLKELKEYNIFKKELGKELIDYLIKEKNEDHTACFSYPCCDENPNGCSYQTDDPEEYGHRG